MKAKLLLVVFVFLAIIQSPIDATTDQIILRLRVPIGATTATETRDLLDQFESQHPHIIVEMIPDNRLIRPPYAIDGINLYFQQVRNQVESADVIVVDSNWLLPEATLAGYFLDLRPMIQQDMTFNADQFIPRIWETVTWDGGIWALPVTFDLVTLFYDRGLLDETEAQIDVWDIHQLDNIALMLARDESQLYTNVGNINGLMLAGMLVDRPLTDQSTVPAYPDYASPILADAIERLAPLVQQGAIVLPDTFGFDYQSSLWVGSLDDALLPQSIGFVPNGATLQFDGFAISGGTPYPEESYQLLRFLSDYPQFVNHAGVGGAKWDSPFPDQPEQVISAIETLLPVAEPWPTYHFTSYLAEAIQRVNTGMNPTIALDQMGHELRATLQTHHQNAPNLQLTVTRSTYVESQPDDVVIRFAVQVNGLPSSREADWSALARRFAENNPDVTRVNLSLALGHTPEQLAQMDCFYALDYNFARAGSDLLRPIEPLLMSDPAYDPADYIPHVFENLTFENQIWGVPLTIEPYVMWINQTLFDEAGAIYPVGSWRTSEFLQALEMLKSSEGWRDEPIITIYAARDTAVTMLIASLGGVPIDTRYGAIQANFTDSSTVNAVYQLVNLISDGKLRYTSKRESDEGVTPIIITQLNEFWSRREGLVLLSRRTTGITGADYTMIPFPQDTYAPIAFRIGAAFITAQTMYPEICYRFIREIMDSSDLFPSVPVRHSLIQDPNLAITHGQETATLYREIAAMITQDNTVNFPSRWDFRKYTLDTWFRVAMESIIFEQQDVEEALSSAQNKVELFMSCLESMDEVNPSTELECAQVADPMFIENMTSSQ